MNEIDKELELSKCLEEWVNSHCAEWNSFYHDVSQNRRNGIYLLEEGIDLMDLLDDIMNNISQAKRALKQIKDKGYFKPYRLHSDEIIGVGISFSEVTKNVYGVESECLYMNDKQKRI